MRQSTSRSYVIWIRRLFLLVLILYFVLGLALVTLRYGVLAHVNDWRPQIAAALSTRLGVDLELGGVAVRWRGWSPQLELTDLRLNAPDGQPLLEVPALDARVSGSAWLSGREGILQLEVQGMTLTVRRLPEGRLALLGQVVSLDALEDVADPDEPLAPWLQWLLSQPLVAFRDTRVQWQDRVRAAPDLQLDQVEAVLARSGAQGLQLSVTARAKADPSAPTRLTLHAQADDARSLHNGRLPQDARAWLKATGFTINAWRPWLDLPDALRQGSADLQVWLDARGSPANLVLQADLASVDWQADGLAWRVGQGRAWLQTSLPADGDLTGWPQAPGAHRFEVAARQAHLAAPAWFDHPLPLGALAMRGQLAHDDVWRLDLSDARWVNADADISFQGQWRSTAGPAGEADVRGAIHRASLAALHRYLPNEVDADAREWLAGGLRTGVLTDGQFLLNGDLMAFPFGEQPEAGDFRVRGLLQDAVVDFVPDAAPEDVWPTLRVVTGTADLHRMALTLTASLATMAPASDREITLRGIQAHIPDLENDPVLTVSGQTEADGNTYMALIRQSPLNGMLDHFFDEATASGHWHVPLTLVVPLLDSVETRVDGEVQLDGAGLQILSSSPGLRDLRGRVGFSERGVQLRAPVHGQLLGGPVHVQGALGEPGQALSFHGRLEAAGAARYVGTLGMKRITGALTYDARLLRDASGYAFTLESDTQGLDLDFPAPLSKPAEQARRLRVEWNDTGPDQEALEIRYGDQWRLSFRHRAGSRKGPYFHQAAVGLGDAATLADGLQIALSYPLIDLDLWSRLADEFSTPLSEQPDPPAARRWWPALVSLSVRADQMRVMGTRLDHGALRFVHSGDGQWSVNVRSDQTTGTLKWRERNGQVVGRVSGRFARLSLGDDGRDTSSLLPETDPEIETSFEDDLEIPGVMLEADELRLYGRRMGTLVVEGVRDAAHHAWTLDRLRIGDDHARLRGTGTWRLRGAQRGLTLQASVEATDLGHWLEDAGWPGVLVGGEGDLKGHFFWRELPWAQDKADLEGSLQLDLEHGRFSRLGSQTAKLLELLSLQSISRLPKLNEGLSGLVQEGVAFDQLRGALSMQGGTVQIDDYKVIGPVGTILLEGSADVVHEQFDLDAVIVPNLDASGAAVAAGIAINPVVGLGAFLTQWLLKTPLAKAMTARYRITGAWEDPQVQEVPVK